MWVKETFLSIQQFLWAYEREAIECQYICNNFLLNTNVESNFTFTAITVVKNITNSLRVDGFSCLHIWHRRVLYKKSIQTTEKWFSKNAVSTNFTQLMISNSELAVAKLIRVVQVV